MDYPINQLGVQETVNGAILVEGSWYCPSMPAPLINATVNYRNANKRDDRNLDLTNRERADRRAVREKTWKALLQTRSLYLFRAKETPTNGSARLMCPAAGPNPTVTCPLKEMCPSGDSTKALIPIIKVPKSKLKVCTNKSSTTFGPSDSKSHGQYYEFGSKEWEAQYHHARNNVESFNGYVKNENTFGLAQPGRRRMRGYTAKMFLVVITVAAANLQKVRDFLLNLKEIEQDTADGIVAPIARSRRNRRISAPSRITGRERNKPKATKRTNIEGASLPVNRKPTPQDAAPTNT
ncbi:hypothetical protein [Mycetocola zhujimingii]|uniref:hypothetical protein n=1 Tax=Mycetocola zhujimingii TaxID=2079792 RepID=UPI0013C49E1D|nr:hypothetical protein [Mycetocola zhujimingii]